MFFFVILVGFAIAAGYSYVQKQDQTSAWTTVAKELGLTASPTTGFSDPRIHGAIDGITVDVTMVITRQSNNRRKLTEYSVSFVADSPPVHFHRQGTMSFLNRLVGRKDVLIGDPRFDDAIVVDTGDEEAIRAYLTPGRQAAIRNVFQKWPDVDFTARRVAVRTWGRESNTGVMTGTIRHLVDVARVLRSPGELDRAVAHQEAGDLAAASESLHELNTVATPNRVTQLLEAETLVALGQTDLAQSVFERLEPESRPTLPPPPPPPARPTPAERPEPVASTEPVAATPELVPQPVALGQQAVIDEVFNATQLSHEVATNFAALYAGRSITWAGEIQAIRPYAADADFGGDPGVKSTITIGAIGESKLFSNQVKAVVDLPAGFEGRRGDTIEFTGTLLRVDPYTRAIFVADAHAS